MFYQALVIDDDENNLDVLARLLKAQGIATTRLTDPAGIKNLQEINQFDVIFCDLEMPRLNGYEILQYIRERLGTTIPIICCTVHLPEINTAKQLGFDGFLGKPLDMELFPEQLRLILERKPVWNLP